jgi:hypothetical protein
VTTAPDPTTIEKTMTLSAGEFAKSIAAFTGGDVAITDSRATVAVNDKGGSAEIAFEALPSRRVGGLLELPQARVTITFANVRAAELDAFVRRFDIAFQRGGG